MLSANESELYTSEVILVPSDVDADGASLHCLYTYNPRLDDLQDGPYETEQEVSELRLRDEGPYGLHRVFTRDREDEASVGAPSIHIIGPQDYDQYSEISHSTQGSYRIKPNNYGSHILATTSKDDNDTPHSLHRVYNRNSRLGDESPNKKDSDELHSLHRIYNNKDLARSIHSLDVRSLHRMNSFLNDQSDTVYSVSAGIHSLHQTLRFNPEMAISNFHVKFAGDQIKYQPGDVISGDVVMDVWATVAVRYVEFIIQGRGTLRMFKGSSFSHRPRHELYLDKQNLLMRPTESGHVVLTPGHYISTFSYRLPTDLPPSVRQTDMGKGFVFDITYSARAHVCDAVKNKHKSSVVRVVKASKHPFLITPTVDWQSLPGALDPILHAEQLLLACTPCFNEPTSVMLFLDRGVYPIGDQIKCSLEIYTKHIKRIKKVYAELEQQIVFRTDKIKKHSKVVLRALNSKSQSPHQKVSVYQGLFLLTVPNLVPSHLPQCRLMDIIYNVRVTVKFRRYGGTLVTRVPVIIAPASEAERQVANPRLPVFDKPIRQFPYFSRSPYQTKALSGSFSDIADEFGIANHVVQRHNRVRSEYNTCFMCCCCECCLGCLKFGIISTD